MLKSHFSSSTNACVLKVDDEKYSTSAIEPQFESKDIYEVMGVEKTATQAEIKRAYRRLSLQWHPDKNGSPEAEERFKEISNAYQVLSDPEKRDMVSQPRPATRFARYPPFTQQTVCRDP